MRLHLSWKFLTSPSGTLDRVDLTVSRQEIHALLSDKKSEVNNELVENLQAS
jgi:hypothetical protein